MLLSSNSLKSNNFFGLTVYNNCSKEVCWFIFWSFFLMIISNQQHIL
jgi:hypothetical protein